ncbi:MAG: DinB family protein, partial [Ignavibacteria bacterium]|nr:DinB family protein [Ignavibacteria bacterium]
MPKLKMSQIQMLNEFLSIKEETDKLFGGISEEQFNKKPNEERWSAAECIAHLNLIAHGYTKYFPIELNTRKEIGNLSDKQYQTRILAGLFI